MNCILFRVIQHNTTNMGHVSPNILKTLIIKKIKRWNKVKNCYNLCDNYSKILCSHIGVLFLLHSNQTYIEILAIRLQPL